MTPAPKDAFPLTWPQRQARTPSSKRKAGRFQATFGQARDELVADLCRLGAINMIVSTNVPLRRDGLPYADSREPDDPGCAVYFERFVSAQIGHRPFVLACDTYDKLRANVRAIGATVSALRTIERHGSSQMLEQAFTGFAALPPVHNLAWWDVLQVAPTATIDEIAAARARLALEHHPDRGGDDNTMAQINRAYDIAITERT